MNADLRRLAEQVQTNCHISDALYARDYSMCIYLLKMREYFRWERGFAYTDPLPKEELGRWLVERERLWETLEDTDFQPMDVGGHAYAPFDGDAINAALVPLGLVYSAGYGSYAKPQFFLGRLERADTVGGRRILITAKEYARDITAPPAMAQQDSIFIRRESLRRMLWEKFEEWQWRKQDGPMARAAACYDFQHDLEEALERMTDNEVDAAILHEVGELEAGELLGGRWERMLAAVARTRAEHLARAVRDHLADCRVTLPALIEAESHPSLHFYFANFQGVRRAVFPCLLDAYQQWQKGRGLESLEEAVAAGDRHWTDVARELLQRYGDEDEGAAGRLEQAWEEVQLV